MSFVWCRVKLLTNYWEENKYIIINIIKPLVSKLEKSCDIINFFFLEYYGESEHEPRVAFVFFGNKEKVVQEISSLYNPQKIKIEDYDPASESYRFGEDYMLGVKMFEIASKLALCAIDDKKPIDKSSGQAYPIFLTLRHAFFQNLGYGKEEEREMAQEIDKYLIYLYDELLKQKIK